MVTEIVTPRMGVLEPPYDPAVAAQLAKMMPPNVPPIALFRTVVQNLPMAEAMTLWGSYELSRSLSLSLRDREIVIDRTCVRCGCEYEWGVHIAFFADKAHLDQDQVGSLTHGGADDPCSDRRARSSPDSRRRRAMRPPGHRRHPVGRTARRVRRPRNPRPHHAVRLVSRDQLHRARHAHPARAGQPHLRQRLLRLQQLGAHEWHQRVGDPHAAVGLLVVLQDRHQPAGGAQRAVERGRDLRLAVRVPVTGRQPARLEGRAVRRRRQLAVGPLGREPTPRSRTCGRPTSPDRLRRRRLPDTAPRSAPASRAASPAAARVRPRRRRARSRRTPPPCRTGAPG